MISKKKNERLIHKNKKYILTKLLQEPPKHLIIFPVGGLGYNLLQSASL
jgi:hypothetical protein